MTQPDEAVEGAPDNDTVIAAEPTVEDRFAALVEEVPEEPEGAEEEPQGEEPPENEPEEETEEEAGDVEEDEPEPIQPPVSWPDEDKAVFADLPRELQERVSEREAERERFVQSKSREAKQLAASEKQAAAERIEQLQKSQIETLVSLLPQIPEEPSAHLSYSDPVAYANAMDHRRAIAAQRSELESHILAIAKNAQDGAEEVKREALQASVELLTEEYPEFIEDATRPDQLKLIEATGQALGYSQDQLSQADGSDILALRKAAGWKDKADKYDALMSKKMEKVREAKKLPRVSRPGTSQGKGAIANQRYTADRNAMREGDRDAAARVFERFLK